MYIITIIRGIIAYLIFIKWISIQSFDIEKPDSNHETSGIQIRSNNDTKLSEKEVEEDKDNSRLEHELLTSENVEIETKEGEGEIYTNNDEHYKLSRDGYTFAYTFPDSVDCVKVSYLGRLIWEYDEKKNHLKGIYFHSDICLVFIEFEGILQMYKHNGESFKLISERELGELSPNKIDLRVYGHKDASEAVPIHPSQYVENLHGFETEYEFERGVMLGEVKYEDKTVWSHDKAEHGDMYPTSLFVNIFTQMLIIDFSKFYLVYQYKDGNWNFISRSTFEGFSPNDFKFFNKDVELDESKFNLTKYPDGFTFIFTMNKDSKCTKIQYKCVDILEVNDPSIDIVYINLYVKMMMISAQKSLYAFMHIDRWKMIFNYNEHEDDQREESKTTNNNVFPNLKSRRNEKNKSKIIIILIGSGLTLLVLIVLFFSLK